MYGGLFGDLPAAKGSSKGIGSKSTTTVATPASSKSTSVRATSQLPVDQDKNKKPKYEASSTSRSATIPPVAATQKQKSNQILKAVGAAGTSMAFVPTAALQKKRKRPLHNSMVRGNHPKPPANLGSPRSILTANAKSANAPKKDEARVSSASRERGSIGLGMVMTETSIGTAGVGDALATEQSWHSTPKSVLPTSNITTAASSSLAYCEDDHSAPISTMDIEDPYDPFVPNDLLLYWERQALAQERQELEREARDALEKQQLLRLQLEKEREALQEKGDYDQLVEQNQQRVSMGRGRGRGVSNLPAWLVEKQKKKEREELGSRI